MTSRAPLTALVTTRDEAPNVERCLAAVRPLADQVFVLDSESSDGTVEIARRWADEVTTLPYDATRIIPWIFQWGLDHLPIRNDWVLILEADQTVPAPLAAEIAALVARGDRREYARRNVSAKRVGRFARSATASAESPVSFHEGSALE